MPTELLSRDQVHTRDAIELPAPGEPVIESPLDERFARRFARFAAAR